MDFSLLETMRLERGRLVRRDRHVARAAASAAALGFAWSAADVDAALDAAQDQHPDAVWRARLVVERDGNARVECTTHAHDPSRIWLVAIAATAVDSSDRGLRHKTTFRERYDRARQSRPDVDDVLLINERGEITESTIANVVAEIDGVRVTPPLASGLLPGVFRGVLIDAGEIHERRLSAADLEVATRLWLINSLREWVPATLVR